MLYISYFIIFKVKHLQILPNLALLWKNLDDHCLMWKVLHFLNFVLYLSVFSQPTCVWLLRVAIEYDKNSGKPNKHGNKFYWILLLLCFRRDFLMNVWSCLSTHPLQSNLTHAPAEHSLPPAFLHLPGENEASLSSSHSRHPSSTLMPLPGRGGGVFGRSRRKRFKSLLKDHMGWLRNPITFWLSIDPEPTKY